jgi:cyclophilin family peptidyl-prolyl cis-trans isomerase/HEAT repeat protein
MPRSPSTFLSCAAIVAALLLGSTGCGETIPADAVGPPVAAPDVEAAPRPWTSHDLRDVVDLQVARDGDGLRTLLQDEDPEIRARAALALASVQDPGAAAELTGLLSDPEPGVRLEAAFALGQIEPGNGGRALLDALAVEEEPAVRSRLLEALGKRGDEDAARSLMEGAVRAPEAKLTMALSRMGVRRVVPEGLVHALVLRLGHQDPAVREAAAYFFGRSASPELWRDHGPSLRRALDEAGPDDPAALHLLIGLGLLQEEEDMERLLSWLDAPTDWRIRTMAARALGGRPFIDAEAVVDALFHRVAEDPSHHVAFQAALSLSHGPMVTAEVEERMGEWLLRGPLDRWETQIPFAGHLTQAYQPQVVLAWARRVQGRQPWAAVRAVGFVGRFGGGEATAFLREVAGHRDVRVRAAALAALGERWLHTPLEEEEMRGIVELLAAAIRRGEPSEAIRGAVALASPAYLSVGGARLALEAARERARPEEAPTLLVALVGMLGALGQEEARPLVQEFLDHPEPRVQVAAADALRALGGSPGSDPRIPDPERTVDWTALEALGPAPRMELETDRGRIAVRLVPEQAPLTVATLAALAAAGRLDGTPFHRVVPNFVAQGGDYTLGDGTGSPGFAMRSEFTRIPFQRGVIGMASSGKDTEGSQFFLTHSAQPHLDGAYTAFGWVEEGVEVMDALQEGDRIVRLRIVAGTEGQRSP